MPKYRVLSKSYINNSLVEENGVVDYDGKPGPNLEPMEPAAEEAMQAAAGELGTKNISIVDLTRQKVASIGGDPEAVDAAKAIGAAGAAAAAALDGKQVIVDGKLIDETPVSTATKEPTGAEGLV